MPWYRDNGEVVQDGIQMVVERGQEPYKVTGYEDSACERTTRI